MQSRLSFCILYKTVYYKFSKTFFENIHDDRFSVMKSGNYMNSCYYALLSVNHFSSQGS